MSVTLLSGAFIGSSTYSEKMLLCAALKAKQDPEDDHALIVDACRWWSGAGREIARFFLPFAFTCGLSWNRSCGRSQGAAPLRRQSKHVRRAA
jgi:hypothetical protein